MKSPSTCLIDYTIMYGFFFFLSCIPGEIFFDAFSLVKRPIVCLQELQKLQGKCQ